MAPLVHGRAKNKELKKKITELWISSRLLQSGLFATITGHMNFIMIITGWERRQLAGSWSRASRLTNYGGRRHCHEPRVPPQHLRQVAERVFDVI